MAWSYEYPRVDASQWNADWILSKMHSLLGEWEAMQKNFDSLSEEVEAFKTYVNEQLAGIPDEILKIVQEKIDDGTFSEMLENADFIKEMKADIATNTTNISTNASDIAALETWKVSVDSGLGSLVQKNTEQDGQITALNEWADRTNTIITRHDKSIVDLNNTTATHTQEIATNTQNIAKNTQAIADLEGIEIANFRHYKIIFMGSDCDEELHSNIVSPVASDPLYSSYQKGFGEHVTFETKDEYNVHYKSYAEYLNEWYTTAGEEAANEITHIIILLFNNDTRHYYNNINLITQALSDMFDVVGTHFLNAKVIFINLSVPHVAGSPSSTMIGNFNNNLQYATGYAITFYFKSAIPLYTINAYNIYTKALPYSTAGYNTLRYILRNIILGKTPEMGQLFSFIMAHDSDHATQTGSGVVQVTSSGIYLEVSTSLLISPNSKGGYSIDSDTLSSTWGGLFFTNSTYFFMNVFGRDNEGTDIASGQVMVHTQYVENGNYFKFVYGDLVGNGFENANYVNGYVKTILNYLDI